MGALEFYRCKLQIGVYCSFENFKQTPHECSISEFVILFIKQWLFSNNYIETIIIGLVFIPSSIIITWWVFLSI